MRCLPSWQGQGRRSVGGVEWEFATLAMASVASLSSSLATGTQLGQKKQELMEQVRSELALANAQELITKMNEKCFQKCVPRPGAKLDSGEQQCLSRCMDRYMEAWNIVSRAYIGRISKESQGNSG